MIASAAASVVALASGEQIRPGACKRHNHVNGPIWPSAAGGPTDVNARVVAEQLGKIWGQQVVIDNKAGAART
jgi:tripartite-type tricarboxylate transporter receptor subunit TctC